MGQEADEMNDRSGFAAGEVRVRGLAGEVADLRLDCV